MDWSGALKTLSNNASPYDVKIMEKILALIANMWKYVQGGKREMGSGEREARSQKPKIIFLGASSQSALTKNRALNLKRPASVGSVSANLNAVRVRPHKESGAELEASGISWKC